MNNLSLLILVGVLVATIVGGLVYRLTRPPFSPLQWLLYGLNLLLVRVLWRADVPRHLPLPADQGAVLISNHRSSIDPCIIQVAAGTRLVHWMVAQLYGPETLIGRLLQVIEIIPVRKRGSDVSPTKTAIRMASEGELVGMMPEGTINTTEDFLLPVRPGAVLVALKARVPILPCYIEGAPYHEVAWMPLFMPARVRLTIGGPVDISQYYGRESEKGVLESLTRDCVREIARLAGRDDFQPRIAGQDWKSWQ